MKNYFIVSFFLLIQFIVSGKDTNVIDYGAVSDGKTLSTEEIQKAIDECSSTGGGTVNVPPGTYFTNTIFLRDNVNLNIQKGATILGSTNPDDFKGALIHAENVQNASITGYGIINGQGYKKFYPKTGNRHNNIWLLNCKNITVKDLTLINSSNWVFRIRESEGVLVQGVRIYSFTNENNDGIDIDGKNIIITGCIIDCDDDAICLKSDNPDYVVENINISNCIIGSNCNAIKCGTGSKGGFKNISISNCIIHRPSEAANRRWSQMIKGVSNDTTVISGIALEVVDGAAMDQVTITNITMSGVQTPLFIRLGNRKGLGSLRNVIISNITATSESLLTSSITGIPGSYIENVIISNVIFNCKGTGTEKEASDTVPEVENAYPENRMFGYSLPSYGLYTRHVKNLIVDNFQFNLLAPDARPAIILDDCHNISLKNFSAAKPSGTQPLLRFINSSDINVSGYQPIEPVQKFLRVEGEKASRIKLTGNDFKGVIDIAVFGKGAKSGSVEKKYNFK